MPALRKKRINEFGSLAFRLIFFLSGIFLLTWPAIFQNAPTIVFDSPDYLRSAMIPNSSSFHGIFYPRWLLFITAGGRLNIFFVPISQAILCGSILYIFFKRYVGGPFRDVKILIAIACLSFGTSLSWFNSQLSPDFLSLIIPVALSTIIFHWHSLSKIERGWITISLIFSVEAHHSNFPIFILLLILSASYFWLTQKQKKNTLHSRPVIAILICLVAIQTINFSLNNDRSIERGPVYLLSRMIYSGRISETLAERCRIKHSALCDHQEVLKDLRKNPDDYLWNVESPLKMLGGVTRAQNDIRSHRPNFPLLLTSSH